MKHFVTGVLLTLLIQAAIVLFVHLNTKPVIHTPTQEQIKHIADSVRIVDKPQPKMTIGYDSKNRMALFIDGKLVQVVPKGYAITGSSDMPGVIQVVKHSSQSLRGGSGNSY
jgi:hypothetical protein